MPRTARLYLIGYPHHIVQRGVNREKVFLNEEDYSFMIECLKSGIEKSSTRLMAYCLMPNHFHLLAVPLSEDGLGRFLHHATFRYAQYFNKKYNRTGRLWQNRYYSSIIDAETYLWAVARYIETNPVRAGLVGNPEEWIWSSAGLHLRGIPDTLIENTDWLSESLRENYRSLIMETSDYLAIRKATISCKPLGSDKFIRKLENLFNRPLKPRPRGRPCKK